jgi:hypothetical protein
VLKDLEVGLEVVEDVFFNLAKGHGLGVIVLGTLGDTLNLNI